ncbi:class I SAM-dependent methyltransferase [Patescibacteria group bacterium]|nr:class I SAM-dependent methyltransferase [Patescibacteria group bacterium]
MSKTYPAVYHDYIEKAEKAHFWFSGRRALLRNVIGAFLPGAPETTFLEVGCGTGLVLELLERMGFSAVGLDVNAKALSLARKKTKAPLIRSSLYTFRTDRQFQAVGSFDVLEHQENDLLFLQRCRSLISRGGYLFLTVPAGKRFWSPIDAYSGHKRRYEARELASLVRRAGFSVLFCRYWNALTLPFFLYKRRCVTETLPERMIADYVEKPPAVVNWLLNLLLSLERIGIFTIPYPAGASLVLVAKRI